MRIQAALPTLTELCPHFSWPPVSAYLHLCLPAFGEQCECSQPNAGTEEVTSLLVLINGALISMIFCLCFTSATQIHRAAAHMVSALSFKYPAI